MCKASFFLLFNYFLSPSLQILPTLNRINPNDYRSVNSPIYWTVELCFLQKCSPQREGTGWMVLVLPRVISSCSRVSASLLCCILGRLELTSVCTGLARCHAACTHTHTHHQPRAWDESTIIQDKNKGHTISYNYNHVNSTHNGLNALPLTLQA